MRSFDKLNPENWGTKPHVKFDHADFHTQLGPYPMAMVTSTLESTGLIHYRQLLIVGNEQGKDIYFVSAESNQLNGPDVVYFCTQEPTQHASYFESLLLLVTPIFFCLACQEVRQYLNLDWDAAPLIEPERQGLLAIPRVCDKNFPNWRSEYRGVIERILNEIPEGIPEKEYLKNELNS